MTSGASKLDEKMYSFCHVILSCIIIQARFSITVDTIQFLVVKKIQQQSKSVDLLQHELLVDSHPMEMETKCEQFLSTEWLIKAALKNCTPPKIYHCLLTTDNRGMMEICLVPSIIPAGHQMVFDRETSNPKIEKCPHDTFQPSNRWSNETVSVCKYQRSDCNGQGELEYWPGNETSDRTCRCDYKMDYVEFNYRERASVGFSKLHSDVYCGYFLCSGTRLQNYSCVDKCPEGMHYPNDSGQCQVFGNNTDPNSTTITSSSKHITNASLTPFNITSSTFIPMNRNDLELLTVKVVVPFCFLLLLVGTILFLRWKGWCPIKRKQDKPRVRAQTERKLHKLTDYIGEWWNLAKELGLTDAEIERIRADHSTSKEQCYNALHTWKKKNDDAEAGWVKNLLQACRAAGVDNMDEVEAVFKEEIPLLTNGVENGNNMQEHTV